MPKELGENLMASLSKVGKTGKTAIRIETEDLMFDPDDKLLAKAIAAAMVAQLRDNLEHGRGPAFEPLPPVTETTIKARKYEHAMAMRGGQASDRFVDNAFRANARNNYESQYTAQRLGRFTPKEGGPRGIVSGMLAQSFAARPNRDGKGVTIFVAAKRGQPRPPTMTGRKADPKSALESVYGDVPIWSPAAYRTPGMTKAMQGAVASIFGKNIKGFRQAALKLIKESAGVLSTINDEAAENNP